MSRSLSAVTSTLKIVIGQSHGYYLANFLEVCYSLWLRKLGVSLVFSIAFGQMTDRCSYCTIHSWLY